MDRPLHWLAICIAVCALVTLLEAQQPFVHGSDLAFAIRTERTKYLTSESIVMRYTVRNVSNGALFVPSSQWGVRCGDPPFLWARLEDSSGKHQEPGYGGSCLGPSPADRMTIQGRMQKEAVLLEPGRAVHGSFTFEPRVLSALKSGPYRLEAILYGWNQSFSLLELSELGRMKAPFLIGEVHAVTHVQLLALPTK